MVERISALQQHYQRGPYGLAGPRGVTLAEIPALHLHQIATWPHCVAATAEWLHHLSGAPRAAAPTRAVFGHTATLLRVKPLKWWVVGTLPDLDQLDAAQGVTLDLSHSRTHIRIAGDHATDLLNRHLPLDLRAARFPLGSVATSTLHHVSVTLWHSPQGYELLLPRGFALSLWQVLVASAAQFGAEIGGSG